MEDFDLAAAGLRADGTDLPHYIEALAVRLESALPAMCQVERRKKKLFGGEKVVENIQVSLGEVSYSCALRRGRVEARRAKEVRGIVIKSEELGLGDWMRALMEDVRLSAGVSEQGRSALEDMLL